MTCPHSAVNRNAATGRHREPITPRGHRPGMAPREDKPINRDHIRTDLLGAAQRLSQHHKHLSADELRELDEIVDQLAGIHTDAVACENLRKRYSDLPARPWGTRYAFWWERAAWRLRRALSRKK